MRLLEAKGISKKFGGLMAVSQVDFHIDQGEIVGLIGPNGAGKTTLFNLISGAMTPSSGMIRFKGEEISNMKPYQVCRKGIARTFQLVKLFGNMTVYENVLLACLFGSSRSIKGSESKRTASKWLEFVGLSDMADISARDLTIANQKRLEVARALSTNPKLLLLDEVMAGLNPTEVAQTSDLVKKIHDKGVTIIIIEHVMKAIMGMSGRIIVLHYGKKISEGLPNTIATDKKVIELYLGT